MKNGEVLIYNFIEDYETRMYDSYKLLKTTNGIFDEKTVRAHERWENILLFIRDEKVDANYTFLQLKNHLDFVGAKMIYQESDMQISNYWSDIAKMYYYIRELIERSLK